MQNGARHERSLPFQILAGVLLAAAATVLTAALKEFTPQFAYGFYYGAVVIAAFFVGIRAGIVAALIGGPVGNLLFIEPPHTLLTTPGEVLHVLTFWTICAVICALIYVSRRNEERLAERERFIQNLAATAPYTLYLYNVPADQIDYVTAESAANSAADGADCAADLQYMHPEDRIRYLQHLSDLTAAPDGTVLTFQYRERTPGEVGQAETGDSQWRWCERQERVYDRVEGGAVQHVLGVVQDIDARKRAEDRVRYQSQLLNSVDQAIIAIDLDRRIIFWNRFAEQLYGWTAAEVEGKSMAGLLTPPAVRGQADEIMDQLRAGRSWSGEFLVQRKDGSTFYVDLIDAPIYDEDGSLVGILGASVDVSQRKRAESHLRFLSDATLALSSSLDYKATIQRVADLAVPRIADWCAVDLLRPGNKVELVAVAHVNPDKVRWAHELRRQYPPNLAEDQGLAKVIKTGVSEFYPDIPQELIDEQDLDAEQEAILAEIGMRSIIIVPMRARGEIIGGLTLVWSESDRHYTAQDVVFAEELANRAAIAVDNARLYEEARASEERFRATFEQAAVGISHVGLDGRWLRVNNRLCEITGYSREELLVMTFQEITVPEDLEADLAMVQKTIAGETDGYQLEKRYRRKDGAIIWVHLTVSLVRAAAAGEPLYFITVIEDITERKAAETQLLLLAESSRVLYTSLVDERTLQAAADLLVPRLADWCVINLVGNGGGVIDTAASSAVGKAGASLQDAIEPVAVSHRDPTRAGVLRELIQQAPITGSQAAGTPEVIRSGRPYFLPTVTRKELDRDARLKLLQRVGLASLIIVPLQARGVTLGSISLARTQAWDCYDERDLRFAQELAQRIALAIDNAALYASARSAELQLRQLNETLEERVQERTAELERSNRELDRFAYIASHDLKAPLRAIDNLSTWLEQDVHDLLPPASQEHLEKLRGRVQRMERLLDDLLAYSRAGRVQHTPQEVDTGALVRAIFELQSPPPGFRLTVEEPLPVLHTQRVPLETVLRNLIGNAIKHHNRPDGRVWVSAQQRECEVEFWVCDDGPGIAPEYHERIFELFQTLQPRDQLEASGLGLAIVKKTVESAGGCVSVRSAEGEGTCFAFTWPAQQNDDRLAL